MKPCAVDGCPVPARSRGWCGRHYMQWYTYGVTPRLERLEHGRPPEPLLALVRGSGREIAEQCGVSRRTVVRWRQGGRVESYWDVADRLGLHPNEIWGTVS